APTSGRPFLPGGGVAVIRWDASGTLTPEPITLEYSLDDGRSWAPINGGAYSKADDGREDWNVPTGPSFDVRVRVSATDVADNTATDTSPRLAKDVTGYVVDANGRVHAFGTANESTRETYVRSGDVMGGIAMRSSTTGYTMTDRGVVHPFAVGGSTMPAKPWSRSYGEDNARGFALRSSSSGYVVLKDGRVMPFGGAPSVRVSKTWRGYDRARGIVMVDTRRGYVLDAYGRLWPFAAGRYSMPPNINGRNLFGTQRAAGVVLRSDERSGWAIDSRGYLTPFGGAPRVSTSGAKTGGGVRAIVRVTNDGGYWVDATGTLHRWGAALGDPTLVTFNGTSARGAAN
ncbi:MAG TPA: hypothetical protein VM600_05925, partial [Actinomycetota bacterium]|nr:hypothetical protein [Actinomycetota bacterium]